MFHASSLIHIYMNNFAHVHEMISIYMLKASGNIVI